MDYHHLDWPASTEDSSKSYTQDGVAAAVGIAAMNRDDIRELRAEVDELRAAVEDGD